jgi:outer membrane immunogenic protein
MNKLLRSIAAAVASLTFAAGNAVANGLKDDLGCRSAFRGLYVGSHVGFGFYTSHQGDLDAYLADNSGFSASDRGIIGGPQVGYNFQRSCRTLFGIEADWSGAGLAATTRLNTNVPLLGFDQRITSVLVNFGTIRTRAGFVVDDTLFYLTGGLAIANTDTRVRNIVPGVIDERFSFSDTRLGWTAGAGVEWALGRNVSVKSEFLYLALGETSNTFSSPTAANTFTFKTEDSAWVSRIGLNIRFGN